MDTPYSSTPRRDPRLNYAAPLPWHQLPRTRRTITFISFLCLLMVLVLWVPWWLNYMRLIYWERQRSRYTAPADEICAEATIDADGRFLVTKAKIPPAWANLYPLVWGVELNSDGTAFLHERAIADQRRLWAVDIFFEKRSTGVGIKFSPRPGRVPAEERQLVGRSFWFEFDAKQRIRIFCGQPDPADASHFTIDVEIDGARRTFDGSLLPNHEVVVEARP